MTITKKKASKKGWHGDSYAHHLASTGHKVKGKTIKKSIDHEIIKNLEIAQRRLTAKQVAKKTGFSWQATNKHLEELYNKGLIQRIPAMSRYYWKAQPRAVAIPRTPENMPRRNRRRQLRDIS